MQENADGTPERIEAESEKLRIAFEKKSRTEAALSETETRLTAAQKLAEEKREYEKLCLEKQRAEARLAYYAERRRKLDVVPRGAAVREKSETLEKCVRAKDLALAATEKAEMSLKGAQRDLEVKRRQLEESGLESEIQDLAVVLGKLQAAEEDIAACREAEARLKECTEKYRAIKNKVPEEDFDALAAANDGALTALGESESFTEFLKHHFKGRPFDGILRRIQRGPQRVGGEISRNGNGRGNARVEIYPRGGRRKVFRRRGGAAGI